MQSSFFPRLRKSCLTAFSHAGLEKQDVKMVLISQEILCTLSKLPQHSQWKSKPMNYFILSFCILSLCYILDNVVLWYLNIQVRHLISSTWTTSIWLMTLVLIWYSFLSCVYCLCCCVPFDGDLPWILGSLIVCSLVFLAMKLMYFNCFLWLKKNNNLLLKHLTSSTKVPDFC